MCGRYTLTVDASLLAELFELEPPAGLAPRYNIAPTQIVPIVRHDADDAREWAEARWGLIPPWAKDITIGSRLINARAETAAEKPSFRVAFASRRCLVPTDGFYEWVKTPGGKLPHHIRFADRRPFAFAGLWETWNSPGGDTVESYTILTTTPNALVAPLHTRMPVILDPARYDEWLQPAPLSPALADELLVPYPGDGLEAVPVSTAVNSVANDDPRCIEPLGTQGTLGF
ncbi:MAG: SOS response-associated peptidase [Thermoanaerobaculales bacterium]|jgi:putative SOS response-associated peptidase YedK|nr:SOS response-associated peptidase [Thermoanaerobaculales bacterium]